MDYLKIRQASDFINKKLVYDENLVWKPEQQERNGFKIGDTVFLVDKENLILTEFKIVVETRYTEYIIDVCRLFGNFREYCTPVERVTLKFISGTCSSGNEYHSYWFNMLMEFPFHLSHKDSKELRELKKFNGTFAEQRIAFDNYFNSIKS